MGIFLPKDTKLEEIEWVGLFFLSKAKQLKEIVWFGLFFLSEVRKLKEIEWFGFFFLIKSQETQGNRMAWAGFSHQKSGNSRNYNGFS